MDRHDYSILDGLNPSQKEAVNNIMGPSLIIAGAGSGKTRVLTCKIARILQEGYPAESILALTFTNKAAREMKERIASIVGFGQARKLWMGTFHSIFIRFLRQEGSLIGFPPTFTIYDTSDSRNIIKACIKELQLDEKIYKPSEVLSRISLAKNNLFTAMAYKANSAARQNDAYSKKPEIYAIYERYAKKCKDAAAMDFDDILLFTNILFRDCPDALKRIAGQFNFLLVDEYQDTNYAQYRIIKALAQKHKNITVVGDDSQSIYAFRGARIENILNFRNDYPQAAEYKLERNYRSTKIIVNAANSLIAKNSQRINKECFSDGQTGNKIELLNAFTEQEEGLLVANSIVDTLYKEKAAYGSFAILYRTNAQSRVVEEALRKKNIPYKIYAGHSFYERAEIKDMLGYLKFLLNEKDDEAFKRIINFPARGIGATTLGKLSDLARGSGLSYSETIKSQDLLAAGIKASTAEKLKNFIAAIEQIRKELPLITAYQAACRIEERFAIIANMRSDTSLEGQSRLENVSELFNSIKVFVEDGQAEYEALLSEGYEMPIITLDLYLENVSLISDLDTKEGEEDTNKVSLMTVHSSKGLEFEYVYIIGMEENLFPSSSDFASEEDIEEERRLFYVALTRAMRDVKLSFCRSRMKWGSHVNNSPSRFLKEIDKEYLLNPLTGGNDFSRFSSSPSSSRSSYPSGRGSYPYGRTSYPSGGQRAIETTIIKVPRQPSTKTDPNFKADPPEKVTPGALVEHNIFGIGKVVSIEGDPLSRKAIVDFKDCGRKTLFLKFAKIRVLE